ncbi:MAG: outer membrane protein transport protein [Parvularculaceae bacterium]|nr:outer membrane protein transport protein [Parvularculaceae bacterium]
MFDRPLVRFGATCLGVVFAAPALAGGFNLEHQNAGALGAAFAGAEAKDGDAGYAAYNPAAIGALDGAEISFNATGVWPLTTYEDAQGVLLGVSPVTGAAAGDGIVDFAVVPNVTIAAPLSERLSVGVIANATFGLSTDYAADSIVRYQARESELTALEISPVVAYRLADGLTIAGGPRFQRVDVTITSTIDAGGIAAASMIPGFAPGSSDLDGAFEGTNWAVGYTVGLNADLTDRLQVGLVWRSKIEHEIADDATFGLAASPAGQILNGAVGLFAADGFRTSIALPASAGLGARIKASERLTLLGSAKVTRWSSFEEVTLAFNDVATPAEILTQDWRDAWGLSAGGEYEVSDATVLRAGFYYDQSPVNGDFASPRIPDGDRYWFAAGVSHDFGDRLSADLGLAYAIFDDREIAISGALPEDLFRGGLSLNTQAQAIAVSGRLRWRF